MTFIRRAFVDDIPALLELLEMLFALEADFHFDEIRARRGLELLLQNPDSCAVFVALADEEVAAMCSAQLVISTAMGARCAWVEDVIVKPDFRGRNIMPRMLEELESWCLKRGATRLQLLCDEQNEAAQAFYAKRGFARAHLKCLQKFLPGNSGDTSAPETSEQR